MKIVEPSTKFITRKNIINTSMEQVSVVGDDWGGGGGGGRMDSTRCQHYCPLSRNKLPVPMSTVVQSTIVMSCNN